MCYSSLLKSLVFTRPNRKCWAIEQSCVVLQLLQRIQVVVLAFPWSSTFLMAAWILAWSPSSCRGFTGLRFSSSSSNTGIPVGKVTPAMSASDIPAERRCNVSQFSVFDSAKEWDRTAPIKRLDKLCPSYVLSYRVGSIKGQLWSSRPRQM